MKNKIKYTCEVCKHVCSKKRNWKTFLLGTIKFLFLVILMVTSMIGSMGLYNFIVAQAYESPDKMISLGQAGAFVLNVQSKFQSEEKIEKLTIITEEIVKDCKSDECKAKSVFDRLLDFPYLTENATELDPIKVWEAGEGDCDQMSYLFMSLLNTQNIKSRIDCSDTHCWNILFLEDKKIIVDIVNYRWREQDE